MKLTFGEIKKNFPRHELCQNDDAPVKNICLDTRRLSPGDIFVAIRGENFDGHDFLAEAFQCGAVAAIVDRPNLKFKNLVYTGDTILALGELAHYYRKKFTKPVIAITGSSGKTTTKELLVHVLSQSGKVTATVGNLNNHIGVPLTIFSFDDDSDYFVVELGMNHFGEIDYLAKILAPTMAVITNVGEAHLEGVGGTLDGVAKAKGELFNVLLPENLAFVCNADKRIKALPTRARKITYGFDADCNVWGSDIEISPEKTAFKIQHLNKILNVELPVAGQYHVQNALAVYAIANELGVSFDKIKKGFLEFRLTHGRGRILRRAKSVLIDNTYNANPGSMRANLKALADQYPTGYKAAVLGSMLELGEQSKKLHEEVGCYARDVGIDAVYAYGELAIFYLRGFGYSEQEILRHHFSDHKKMAQALMCDVMQRESVILVQGSRGMKMESLFDHL